MTEIKPRVEDESNDWQEALRALYQSVLDGSADGWEVALVERRVNTAVRRMAVELEAWRSGRLEHAMEGRFYIPPNETSGPRFYDTIEDAVDALLAEQEDASKLMTEREE